MYMKLYYILKPMNKFFSLLNPKQVSTRFTEIKTNSPNLVENIVNDVLTISVEEACKSGQFLSDAFSLKIIKKLKDVIKKL